MQTHRITGDIACLNTEEIPASLISTKGFHCNVWQSTGIAIQSTRSITFDVVIKQYRGSCSLREVEILHRDYLELKAQLEDIIPAAIFVPTLADGLQSVIVVAETVYPWFNIANPLNEEEVIPLLKKLPKAKDQLERFVAAARRWYCRKGKVIDLYGIDNLVLDKNREIKYLDSFSVFFYEDLLYLVNELDEMLKERIDLSLKRRDYLEYILRESKAP